MAWLASKLGETLTFTGEEEEDLVDDSGTAATSEKLHGSAGSQKLSDWFGKACSGISRLMDEVNEHVIGTGATELLAPTYPALIPPRPRRCGVIAVVGSGPPSCKVLAETLGIWIARNGLHLLTSGTSPTVRSVARAFASVPDRQGYILGLCPGEQPEACKDMPPWVEMPICAPLSQNGACQAVALSSDIVVCFLGSEGRPGELAAARKLFKPVCLVLQEAVIAAADMSAASLRDLEQIPSCHTMPQIIAAITAALSVPGRLTADTGALSLQGDDDMDATLSMELYEVINMTDADTMPPEKKKT